MKNKGPYSVEELFGDWYVKNANNEIVCFTQNGKFQDRPFQSEADADIYAAALTIDDSAYQNSLTGDIGTLYGYGFKSGYVAGYRDKLYLNPPVFVGEGINNDGGVDGDQYGNGNTIPYDEIVSP